MISQVLVNGLLQGGILALVGLGFSLVWGILNIINLAHAAFIMLGAYLTLLPVGPARDRPVPDPADQHGGAVRLGYVLQSYVINLVMRAPLLVTFVLTFGFETFFVNLARALLHRRQRGGQPDLYAAALVMGGTIINWMKLGAFVVALLLTGGLYLFMRYTRTGNAIRAVGMDADAARLMGINIGRHLRPHLRASARRWRARRARCSPCGTASRRTRSASTTSAPSPSWCWAGSAASPARCSAAWSSACSTRSSPSSSWPASNWAR